MWEPYPGNRAKICPKWNKALVFRHSFAREGIHSATASFKETKHYFEILGGRFIGHGKVEKFKVEKLESEIFDGIGDFVVRDELYIHELKSGITVHFTAKHEGKDVPVVWTVRYSKGKVCYAVLGHTTASMKHPAVQEILRRGLAWKMPPLLQQPCSNLLNNGLFDHV
jgi:type 1 glutamine amidotransferase